MITSKLTTQAQTTIPESILVALHLQEGDEIAYEIDGGRVVISKAGPAPDDPFATFGEWDSAADRAAYAKL